MYNNNDCHYFGINDGLKPFEGDKIMTDYEYGKKLSLVNLNDEQRSDVKWMVSNFHWTIHQAIDAVRDGWKRSDFEDSKQSDTHTKKGE